MAVPGHRTRDSKTRGGSDDSDNEDDDDSSSSSDSDDARSEARRAHTQPAERAVYHDPSSTEIAIEPPKPMPPAIKKRTRRLHAAAPEPRTPSPKEKGKERMRRVEAQDQLWFSAFELFLVFALVGCLIGDEFTTNSMPLNVSFALVVMWHIAVCISSGAHEFALFLSPFVDAQAIIFDAVRYYYNYETHEHSWVFIVELVLFGLLLFSSFIRLAIALPSMRSCRK